MLPTPVDRTRLKPSERLRSVVNCATAGEMATPQVEPANPATKARATSRGANGTVARSAERHAIATKAANKVERMPKRRIAALACDTDGIDGTQDNAGAIVYPDTVARAAALGIGIEEKLAQNDGYGFFAALGDLVVTRPTLTNVNDFRAILVLAPAVAG